MKVSERKRSQLECRTCVSDSESDSLVSGTLCRQVKSSIQLNPAAGYMGCAGRGLAKIPDKKAPTARERPARRKEGAQHVSNTAKTSPKFLTKKSRPPALSGGRDVCNSERRRKPPLASLRRRIFGHRVGAGAPTTPTMNSLFCVRALRTTADGPSRGNSVGKVKAPPRLPPTREGGEVGPRVLCEERRCVKTRGVLNTTNRKNQG